MSSLLQDDGDTWSRTTPTCPQSCRKKQIYPAEPSLSPSSANPQTHGGKKDSSFKSLSLGVISYLEILYKSYLIHGKKKVVSRGRKRIDLKTGFLFWLSFPVASWFYGEAGIRQWLVCPVIGSLPWLDEVHVLLAWPEFYSSQFRGSSLSLGWEERLLFLLHIASLLCWELLVESMILDILSKEQDFFSHLSLLQVESSFILTLPQLSLHKIPQTLDSFLL